MVRRQSGYKVTESIATPQSLLAPCNVRSPVRTLPPREYGGALVVWPGMPFPNLDGRIHQSLVFFATRPTSPMNSHRDGPDAGVVAADRKCS
jgi:hypothetical protein